MYLQPVLHKYMHIRYYFLIWTVSTLPLCMILNQYWQINKKLLLPAGNKYKCVNSLTSLVDGAEANLLCRRLKDVVYLYFERMKGISWLEII